MVTKVETQAFAGRPTTLGEKLIQDARGDLSKLGLGQASGTDAAASGRVVEDTVSLSNTDFATVDLGGQKVVNFAAASQSADEVRNAKAEDLPAALDRGLARSAHVGNLFRTVFKGLFSLFRGRA